MQLLNTPDTWVFPRSRIVDRDTGCYLETSACQYVITISAPSVVFSKSRTSSLMQESVRRGCQSLPLTTSPESSSPSNEPPGTAPIRRMSWAPADWWAGQLDRFCAIPVCTPQDPLGKCDIHDGVGIRKSGRSPRRQQTHPLDQRLIARLGMHQVEHTFALHHDQVGGTVRVRR